MRRGKIANERKTILYIITSLIILSFSNLCFGQNYKYIPNDNDFELPNYKPYKPNNITKYDLLPEPIKNKIKLQLVYKLGKKIYEQTKFVRGKEIEQEKLIKIDPDAQNWKSFSIRYALLFDLTLNSKGIQHFYIKLYLGKNGEIIRDINFPDVSHNKDKSKILSISEAINIAKTYNIPMIDLLVNLDYNEELDVLIWTIVSSDRSIKFAVNDEGVKINAHTEEIIKRISEHGIE